MKKYFNIKKLIISVFAFICFFMINEKVEAIQCRYSTLGAPSITADAFENEYDNYQVEFSNDSGSLQISIYDKKYKKKIDLSGNKAQLGNYTFQYIGSLNSDISLGSSCPTTLNYFSDSIMTDLNGKQSVPYKYYTLNISANEFVARYCYDNSLSRCGQITLDCTDCYKKTDDAYDKCLKDGYSDSICQSLKQCYAEKSDTYCKNWLECIKQGNGVKYCSKDRVSGGGCVYASYDDAKDNVAKDNHFSLYLEDLSIPQSEKIGDYAAYSMNVGFKKEDLSNPSECPEILFLNKKDTQYTVSLYASGKESKRLGILKTSIISHDKNKVININDVCDKLEGTKTLEWVKRIYTLLRFLVPTLIIILSVIDFLGVVLSGDSDKMEKAKNKFIKRIVIGVIFILVPFILEFVLRMAGIIDKSLTDVVCRIIR